MRIAFLLTSYNRKETTLRCIRQLRGMSLSLDIDSDIYLVDDNSTDGTFESVRVETPYVKTTKTIGDYYWGRGMYVAWYEALKNGYDAYIWVNDDNKLYDNALPELMDCANATDYNAIICGSFCSKEGKITYGGCDKQHKKITPTGQIEEVYYMNGNLVLVPQSVVEKIGIIDPTFQHIQGDYDYGLMALEQGIKVYTTRHFIGESEQNPRGLLRGRDLGKTIKERLYDSFHSPFLDNPVLSMYFNIKHGKGIFISMLCFLKQVIMNFVPDWVYKKNHNI